MATLLVNKIQCNNCKDIIESRYTHHYNGCRCFWESSEKIYNYAGPKYKDEQEMFYTDEFLTFCNSLPGVAVDGGKDYQIITGIGYTDLSTYEYSKEEQEDLDRAIKKVKKMLTRQKTRKPVSKIKKALNKLKKLLKSVFNV